MKRLLALLAMLMPLVRPPPAQCGWIDSSGRPLPDTESMKSAGNPGVQIVLTASENQLRQTWYSSRTPPKLKTTGTVHHGETVSAMLNFHGCAPGKNGVCDAVAEFKIEGPSGARTVADGGPLWDGKPAPQRVVLLGRASMTAGFDSSDPVGVYGVFATMRDKVPRKTLSVSALLKLTE